MTSLCPLWLFMFVRLLRARSLLPRDDLSRGERQEQLPMLDAFQAE